MNRPIYILFCTMLAFMAVSASCTLIPKSSNPKNLGSAAGFERRRVEEYFVSSGVERYFLPEVPSWANFSEAARCRRKTSIKFFNMDALRSSLRLDYEESIQLQLMFNDEIQKIKEKNQISHIPFENEEETFYQVSDRIQAGIRVFRKPNFKRVNVVWVDSYLENIAELKKTLTNPDMYKGHPVFVSLCMTFHEMGQWMSDHDFDQRNIRKISYELLTPYNKDGQIDTAYHLNFDEILKNKNIYIYVKKSWAIPSLFDGKFKLVKL